MISRLSWLPNRRFIAAFRLGGCTLGWFATVYGQSTTPPVDHRVFHSTPPSTTGFFPSVSNATPLRLPPLGSLRLLEGSQGMSADPAPQSPAGRIDPPDGIFTPAAAGTLAPTANDGVVKLPSFVVSQRRELRLNNVDVLNDRGLSDLLFHRYPGASFKGQDPVLGRGAIPNYAALMYEDDRRLERLRDWSSLPASPEDKTESKQRQQELDHLFLRTMTPLQDAMDRSYNRGRR